MDPKGIIVREINGTLCRARYWIYAEKQTRAAIIFQNNQLQSVFLVSRLIVEPQTAQVRDTPLPHTRTFQGPFQINPGEPFPIFCAYFFTYLDSGRAYAHGPTSQWCPGGDIFNKIRNPHLNPLLLLPQKPLLVRFWIGVFQIFQFICFALFLTFTKDSMVPVERKWFVSLKLVW